MKKINILNIIILIILLINYNAKNYNYHIEYKIHNKLLDSNEIKIEDEFIKVNNNEKIISNIPIGYNVSYFKSLINKEKELSILSKDGHNKENEDILVTGDKLILNNNEYILSLSGDISGNGKFTNSDITEIAKYIIDKNNLTSKEKILSADFNNDNQIKMNDAMKILKSMQGKTKIHFLNTGNSDAILLESNNHYGMIDAARPADALNIIIPYLNKLLGDNKLDFIIVTHPHNDHIGGVVNIASSKFVDKNTKYYYGKYDESNITLDDTALNITTLHNNAKEAMSNAGCELIEINETVHPNIQLGDFKIKFLNYENDKENVNDLHNKDANRNSIAELISYNNYKIFLGGDMEIDDEERFICSSSAESLNECRKDKIGRVDIFKMNHHGSTTSNSIKFIDELKPMTSIITAEKFSHISNTPMENYRYMQKYYNTKIYDTALTVDDLTSEAIIISFDESGYTVKGNDNIDGKNAILDISSSYSNTENPNWEKITLFQETGWYYFENDISKKGWNQVTYKPNNEACYYFYPVSGVMLTGWQVINKRLYYLGPQSGLISGIKQKGNITIDSTTYVLDNVDSCNDNHGYLTGYLNNGTITKGWINIDDKTYYLDDENKIAVSEWKKINDNWYHFDSQGQILTGWQKFNEKWYYLGDDGIMINDKCMTINNKDFCFDTNGVCYSGNGC